MLAAFHWWRPTRYTSNGSPTLVRADTTTKNLQKAWPDWKIWRSDGGSWMATRRGTLTAAEIRARLAYTLMEPNAEQLVDMLTEQAEIAESLT